VYRNPAAYGGITGDAFVPEEKKAGPAKGMTDGGLEFGKKIEKVCLSKSLNPHIDGSRLR